MATTENTYECKHVTYCPKPDNADFDLHVAKLIEHRPDGTSIPKLKFIKNFKKTFWIAKLEHRNHQDKRERIDLNNTIEYKSTRAELYENVCKALDLGFYRGNPRNVWNSPFLYGNDISTESLIKHKYMSRYDKFTYSSICVFDIETDVIHGTDEIIMATLSFKDKVHTVLVKKYFTGYSHLLKSLEEKFEFYLGDYKKKRNITWTIGLYDKPGQAIAELFKKAHEWKPDFVTGWNINFDISRTLKAFEKENINPADVFSDPAVPKPFRHFKFEPGQAMKAKNNDGKGAVQTLADYQRWSYVICPASFTFSDSMQAYYSLRLSKPNEPNYKLDSILYKEIGIRKLKFEEANHIQSNTIEWHKFMQQKYLLEYVIYNVFDCISCEELDEKTLDLALKLPQLLNCSEYKNFSSQPRRVMDQYHWFLLSHGYVSGCSGNVINEKLDKMVVPLRGWIVTLPAHLIKESDNNFFSETDKLKHSIHVDVADADIAASYPNGISVFNISKETTTKELCSIDGLSFDDIVRHESINLSGGFTNSVAFMTRMCAAPTLLKIDEAFTNFHKTKNNNDFDF
jgi:hypothetical protein